MRKIIRAESNRCVCSTCDAWVQYDDADIRGERGWQYIYCPGCGRMTDVNRTYWLFRLPLYLLGFVIVGGGFTGAMWLAMWVAETIKSLI